MMTAKKLAALLDGRDAKDFYTEREKYAAKEAGLVFVFSDLDDSVFLDGAILADGYCPHGGRLHVSKDGFVRDINACTERTQPLDIYYLQNESVWSYNIPIRHEKFRLMDSGRVYCEGIVFSASDI